MDLTRRISVITPVFQAAEFVEKAVTSALACPEVAEVILIEDGSSDNSLSVCQELAGRYSQVRLLLHPNGVNKGAGASRNLGIGAATGDFIAFLDADDFYLPHRFSAEGTLFVEECVDAVYGALGTYFYSEAARESFFNRFPSDLTTLRPRVPPENLLSYLSGASERRGNFSIDTLTLRRSAASKVGPFDETLAVHQDTQWILRLAAQCRVVAGQIDQPVAVRGVHSSNRITSNFDRARAAFLLYGSVLRWATQNEDLVPLKVHRVFFRHYYIARLGRVSRAWKKQLLLLWFAMGGLPYSDEQACFEQLAALAGGRGWGIRVGRYIYRSRDWLRRRFSLF